MSMAEEKSSNDKIILVRNKLPLNLVESIKSIARKQGYIHYEIVSKKLSTDGGSYMGILYEIYLKGETHEGLKEVNIFAKNIVENIHMPIYSIPGVFETEAWVYTELFKIFTEIQDKAKVPDAEKFKMAYNFDECNSECILLEHLGKKGFKLYQRMEVFTLEYADMCLRQLAKFHALSFVLQVKRPPYFKDVVIKKIQPFIFGEDWYAFVKHISNYSINCLESSLKEKLKEKLLEKTDNFPKYMTDTLGVCTLCHGDYKLNNVMAKEVNGKLTEVIPIDYQILHYGCPVLDFIYFVFQGTDREFRRNHLTHLKSLYYETMAQFLRRFDINIEDFFPREEFEKMYRDKLDYGLMINIIYGPFLFAVEGEAPDVTTEDLSSVDFKVDNRFTDRVRGIVDDFVQWGYI